jgi:hypothetical protein
MTSKVIGLKSASMISATTALNPIALAGSRLVVRKAEMTSKMMNPANEKHIPRPIILAVRMFYS